MKRCQPIDLVNLKYKQLAIIGYGSQGKAQAANLRDNGFEVLIGLRETSPARSSALQDGFPTVQPGDAMAEADVVVVLIADEAQPELCSEERLSRMKKGAYLGFAHGLSVHSGHVRVPNDINVFLAAPRGPGPEIRKRFIGGTGFACSIAVHQDSTGDTLPLAREYACAIGALPGAVYETTFAEECQADLFGEQAILCGGLIELIRTGYETLTEAGFSPEMAYFECLHEVKLIADLLHDQGIAGMRRSISATARYGGLTRGRRVVGSQVRAAMQEILLEIQSGRFADELFNNPQAMSEQARLLQRQEAAHPMEEVGARIRQAIGCRQASEADSDGLG